MMSGDHDKHVKVNLWFPDNIFDPGHSSLSVGEKYLSVWPKTRYGAKGWLGKWKSTEIEYRTYAHDIKKCSKIPDETLEFNVPNETCEEMLKLIEKMKSGRENNIPLYYTAHGQMRDRDVSCTSAIVWVLSYFNLIESIEETTHAHGLTLFGRKYPYYSFIRVKDLKTALEKSSINFNNSDYSSIMEL